MRLMVIGHPFLSAYNQRKYAVMQQLDPSLRLRIIAPQRWRERFDWATAEVHPGLRPEQVIALPAYFAKSQMTYVHSPSRLAAALREFHPDVIHLEEEPQAFITVQTIALKRVFAPNAAVTLFSWDNLLRHRQFPLGILKRALRAFSLRRAAAMICGNQRAAELLRREDIFRGTVAVLPQYGLDPGEHAPGVEPGLRAELGLTDGVVVGYFGRMIPEKGIRLLLSSLTSLKNYPWKLLLVGSGPLEPEIRAFMNQHPGRVVFLPPVSYAQVSRYLRCCDIFVLASQATHKWMEQFGLAMAQAMMLGIPCVASTSGAIPEVLGPGGLLFQEGDGDDLRTRLEQLLASTAQRERLRTSAREFAMTHYTAEVVGEKYLSTFRQVCGRPASQAAVVPVDSTVAASNAVLLENSANPVGKL